MLRLILPIVLLFSLDVTASDQDWFALEHPDQQDWSEKRKQTYQVFKADVEPEAVLEIPAIAVAAVVYSDEVRGALEGGITRVSMTAEPGASGNIAIAGHRDSFFRRLEGISPGTVIKLGTGTHRYSYEVTEVYIVDALDISPLDDTEADTLTLITCYPFYYKGYAPDRYIVRANLVNTEASVAVDLADSTRIRKPMK